MKAVLLDQATLSIDLPAPKRLTAFERFDKTAPEQIIERCKDADIIITNKVVITADIMAQLPKLKLVQICATGTDNVDKAYAKQHGITVKNVADYSEHSVPEHTFMLMLNAMRAGFYYHKKATDGSWQEDGKFCLNDMPILDLYGKTLGIIGAGTLGRAVADIASAFGMNVLYAERQSKTPRDDSYTAFDTVLKTADVLSLHCPLTDDTRHLINKDTLAIIKDGQKTPLLINMARGGCVDTQAVVDAINDDTLLGFACDVLEQEPPKADEPLLALADHPRIFITPHNAWASKGAQAILWDKLCRQVSDFVQHCP